MKLTYLLLIGNNGTEALLQCSSYKELCAEPVCFTQAHTDTDFQLFLIFVFNYILIFFYSIDLCFIFEYTVFFPLFLLTAICSSGPSWRGSFNSRSSVSICSWSGGNSCSSSSPSNSGWETSRDGPEYSSQVVRTLSSSRATSWNYYFLLRAARRGGPYSISKYSWVSEEVLFVYIHHTC